MTHKVKPLISGKVWHAMTVMNEQNKQARNVFRIRANVEAEGSEKSLYWLLGIPPSIF